MPFGILSRKSKHASMKSMKLESLSTATDEISKKLNQSGSRQQLQLVSLTANNNNISNILNDSLVSEQSEKKPNGLSNSRGRRGNSPGTISLLERMGYHPPQVGGQVAP